MNNLKYRIKGVKQRIARHKKVADEDWKLIDAGAHPSGFSRGEDGRRLHDQAWHDTFTSQLERTLAWYEKELVDAGSTGYVPSYRWRDE